MQNSLTVVSPVLNEIETISQLFSLMVEDDLVDRLLICDNGSNDGTFELCKQFESKCDKVTVIQKKKTWTQL